MKLYQHIERLWRFMQCSDRLVKSDCIFVLGSNDVRVAEYASQLYLEGWADYLIFSGGVGRLTQGVFEQSEADTFAQVARDSGISSQAILIENQATNTGENVVFTHQLIQQQALNIRSFILVQKPYMERRSLATFVKQWPDDVDHVCVSSTKQAFCDYFNEEIDLYTTLTAVLGDFERIRDYPALGYQIEQPIPAEVQHSYQMIKSVLSSL
ncbi:YdcF family protein [Vibrio sp. JPW-9-11-11]|uniref:YdcF family protein n=1 Tax=Vibrio sp. JPW-9-11-11 TaxID=1416532 RepID=UPI0015933602|nr:YdcF family protein [Vibrio sp. JPW-9-11-11]NVD06307.1 YdcF family protein [Vibrio sp. JPW-9-11-11]